MRDTRETLAMLTAHGIGELDMPRGGIPDMTSMDVAAAMGMGVDRLGAELLMVKYTDDLSHLRDLGIAWFMHVMERGKMRYGWESERPGQFRAMSDATLAENLSLNLCPVCHGRAEVEYQRKPVTCRSCDGSGKRYPSAWAMAREIGVNSKQYAQSWSERVQWCRDELESKERVAVSLIWANLR